jgi:hypothetical protein
MAQELQRRCGVLKYIVGLPPSFLVYILETLAISGVMSVFLDSNEFFIIK